MFWFPLKSWRMFVLYSVLYFQHLKNIKSLLSSFHGFWWEICSHSICFSPVICYSLWLFSNFLFFFLKYILLRYSWLKVFQVHSKMCQLYKYTYIIFKIIFHHRLLLDIDYGSLCCTVHLCYLLHIYFFIINLAFYSY